MRVAFVIYGSPDQRSGGYLYDRRLAAALGEDGHEVAWVSLIRADRYAEESSSGARGKWVDETVETKPDLVLIDELNHAAVLPSLDALRRRAPRSPIVGLVHHLRRDEPGHPLAERLLAHRNERAFLRGCDAWLVNSGVTRRRVRRVSATIRPTGVSPPGCDALPPVDGAPARAERAPWKLLFVGSVTPRKNLERLIEAIAPLSSVHLEIVGDPTVDPDYTRRLESLADRRRARDRVTFAGPLADDELTRRFAAAHLFAAPSWYEGFGIVYAEALAAGLPTIASARGGGREVLGDSLRDWLVDPGDTRAIRRRIIRMTASGAAWSAAASRARARGDALPRWRPSMAGAVRFLAHLQRARNSSNS